MAGVAVAAVVLVVAGVFWARRGSDTPPPAAATVEPGPTDPARIAVPPPTPAAPTAAPPVSPAVPESGNAAGAAPKAQPAGTPAADPSRAGAPPSADAARNAAASAGRGAVVEEPPVEVRDVKLLTITGKKTKDDDVFVSFANGQLSILPKEQGTPLVSWPYKNVLKATYIKSRDPRWDTSLASPPDDLDVGGILRTSKNWFVLQNRDAYLVLRLSDANYARVIELIESRAGIRVARPQPDADKK